MRVEKTGHRNRRIRRCPTRLPKTGSHADGHEKSQLCWVLAACPPMLRASHTRIANVQRQVDSAPPGRSLSSVSWPSSAPVCPIRSRGTLAGTVNRSQVLAHVADTPAGLLGRDSDGRRQNSCTGPPPDGSNAARQQHRQQETVNQRGIREGVEYLQGCRRSSLGHALPFERMPRAGMAWGAWTRIFYESPEMSSTKFGGGKLRAL